MNKQSQNKQIEYVYSVIRDVVREWWVVLCIAMSAAFLAYIGSYFMYQPTFTSSTTFVVSAKSSSMGAYGNLTEVQKLTDTFKSVMDSQILKKKVAEAIGEDSFKGSVEITVVPETNLLTVSVTSKSPEIAYRLLKGILDNYESVAQNVFGEVVMEIFEEPSYPSVPNERFNGNEIMKKVFVLAFAAMAVIFGVISFLKDSVKLEEDVTEKLDTSLFAVLEHESPYRNTKAFLKRQKKKIILTEPAVSFGFAETVKKMRTKLTYLCKKDQCQVIMVTSTMKKEGKTTVAVNLATSMTQKGDKVLLIEGDLRKSELADFIGIEVPEEYGIGEELEGINLSARVYKDEGTGLYILANKAVHKKSTEFLASPVYRKFLEDMRTQMDYIIIDAPAAKGRADVEIFARMTDCAVLVVKQNFAKVPFINDTIDMLNSYGRKLVGCIFNDVYTSSTLLSSGYGYGYGYGYGRYGYGRYSHYGKYGRYGKYGHYGKYGRYQAYAEEFSRKESEGQEE